jgi:hypothetical protein
METKTHPFTCVSGYWNVHNKHDSKYLKWFNNTLQINCPYVFFSDKEGIKLIKSYRKQLPTVYIECNITDFVTYKYKDKIKTHPVHCPSVELNLIWHEKIFLIQKALQLNPFSSDFFCWVDAGLCCYRDKFPPTIQFPNYDKLNLLPQYKFVFCSSKILFDESEVKNNNYYHYISGTYILHKNIIDVFATMYDKYLTANLDNYNILTDQVILTNIYKDYEHLFYKLADGYGAIIPHLY